jgi:cell division transport system permease protein
MGMDFRTAFTRAKRGFRDDLRLHLVAVASLVIAFLCLGAALLSVENLSRVAERWSQAGHLTVYLKDRAGDNDVAQLRLVLESLQEVTEVRHVTAAQAKREFAENVDVGVEAEGLPTEAFPASLEIELAQSSDPERVTAIAERVRRFGAVEEVETYRDWFEQMGTLLSTGQSAVAGLALLVLICVMAIIGNTIRLAVVNRRKEIEVLKLCGATDSFVRSPFLLEGALQATAAALVSLVLLFVLYFALHGQLEGTITALTGVSTRFLSPALALSVVVGAGLTGALGSALSLRRYLDV